MKNRSHLLQGSVLALLALMLTAGSVRAQVTNPVQTTARQSPDWLRSSVVYQVFPRNFSAEGNLNAITGRLDELQDLGVNVLWLMPIHPIGQKMKKGSIGSPYAVGDFYAVNPDYGTTNDLKRLVTEAHRRGMKVVLDIVAGHTAWDSVLMNQPDFYRKDEAGKVVSPNPAWTDVAALDYANAKLRRYMIEVMKYWEREFDVDGYRCDVAFTVPTEFWETARAELEAINPEFVLLADANAKPNLLVKAFDMDNSWPLFYALNRVMTGLSPATFLQSSWENTRQQFPRGALHLRFSDSQPEPRAVARFGVQGALAAQVFMLMLDGVPLFYNGMEVGDATESADPALFEKLPIYWSPGGRPPLRTIYRDLIRLRKQHAAFHTDEVVWLTNSVPDTVTSFMRRDDQDEFLMLINLSSHEVTGTVQVANAARFKPVVLDSLPGPTTSLPDFSLGHYEWQIYHRKLAE